MWVTGGSLLALGAPGLEGANLSVTHRRGAQLPVPEGSGQWDCRGQTRAQLRTGGCPGSPRGSGRCLGWTFRAGLWAKLPSKWRVETDCPAGRGRGR